jgi:polysaccharide biosynthesis/export protein
MFQIPIFRIPMFQTPTSKRSIPITLSSFALVLTSGSTVLALPPGDPAIRLSTPLPPSPRSVIPPVNALPTASGIDLTSIPLKPGDRIRINVVGFPDFSGEQIILGDGQLQLPLAGYINVAGMSPTQAATAITTLLEPYIRRPQVAFSVLALSTMRINVTGEVLQPGPRSLEPTKIQTNSSGTQTIGAVTLSDAVTLAGGITPNADLRNIVVHRRAVVRDPGSTAPRIINQALKVNLWDVLTTGDLTADLQLMQGDEVMIPKATTAEIDRKALLSSTLAPAKIRIQVAGEVQKPGQVDMAANASMLQALAAAGGPTREAKNSQIMLYRGTSDGQIASQKYTFGQEAGSLQDGDVIVVGRQKGAKFLDTLGRVLSPLSSLFFFIKR